MRHEKKTLVILTTHFGRNFSGGSRVTHEIFCRLEKYFGKIIVIGNQLGEHSFENLEYRHYNSWLHALMILSKLKRCRDIIFYGDFYNAFFFVILGLPFYFTYHDNWPALSRLNWLYKLKGVFYGQAYGKVFKSATKVFSVSNYALPHIKKYTEKVKVVRNGASFPIHTGLNSRPSQDLIMVGNIDERKYQKAIPVFDHFLNRPVQIDIYGKISSQKIYHQLRQYPFVNYIGYKENIPYRQYKLLVHTSFAENLPLSIVEALTNGIKVIAYDIGGIGEVINSDNGCLIAPFDASKMVSSIEEILANNAPQINGRKITFVSWDDVATTYHKEILHNE